MKENSIEETIKQLKLMLKVRKEQKEIIECAGGSCINCDPDIKALTESIDILSDYKRVLKENEELKEDRKNNNVMISLAQNELLNYMSGYEDGKKHKMTAMAQVIENQQYYIVRKQMEKYEEHIKRLQKENEELKNQEATQRKINELLVQRYSNSISVQKVKAIIDRIDYDIKKTKEIISNNSNIYTSDRKNDYQIVRLKAMNTKSLDIKKRLQELLESEK